MKKIIYLLLILFSVNSGFSQNLYNNVIASTGGSNKINDIEISWTLGESIINTYNDNNLLLTHGFHQPYYKVLNVHNNKEYNNDIKIIITQNILAITIEKQDILYNELLFEIHNIRSQKFISGDIEQNLKTIDISNICSGVYFLIIRSKNTKINHHYLFVKQ
jgi:hypothetical protein